MLNNEQDNQNNRYNRDNRVRDAEEQLRNIIVETIFATHGEDDRVLTDFVVLAARQGFDEQGNGITSYDYVVPFGDMPMHRLMGLIWTYEKLLSKELLE